MSKKFNATTDSHAAQVIQSTTKFKNSATKLASKACSLRVFISEYLTTPFPASSYDLTNVPVLRSGKGRNAVSIRHNERSEQRPWYCVFSLSGWENTPSEWLRHVEIRRVGRDNAPFGTTVSATEAE